MAFGQQALAEGAAAAAGTPPAPLLSPHGHSLSEQLRFLRRRLREYVAEQTAVGGVVTMYDAGGGMQYPTEQWTVHFFKWLRAQHVRGGRRRPCVGVATVRRLCVDYDVHTKKKAVELFLAKRFKVNCV